ncbi:MAG: N-6 DNA methylase [Sphingobacteriales bacterium]|nr:N-6 DNA methylase [Sphingobacteriales bacterium]
MSTMEKYVEFIETLKTNISTFNLTPRSEWVKTATHSINGLAAEELRRLVDINTRRSSGAFFTDSELAEKILTRVKPVFTSNSIIYDSACGAGNLLIAALNYMQTNGLELSWEKHIRGTDLHAEFVKSAQLRLTINALINSQTATEITLKKEKNKKYHIKKADGLKDNRFYKSATHIFVNPPFNQILSCEKLLWAKGKVSAAALFIDKIIQYCKPGTSIIAILPDVLRSGSRYEKWRSLINRECTIEYEELLGRFDKYADVDVYVLHLIKRFTPIKDTIPSNQHTNYNQTTLEDTFDICVGPVVDNRDKYIGDLHNYVKSRGLKGWSMQRVIEKKRRHKGKKFKSPFVVIKRTSRKEDSHRAIATIVNTTHPSYVDNHLIILKPKSGLLRDCKNVLQILKDQRTDKWINERIRCRHLTVKIVKKIPVWK